MSYADDGDLMTKIATGQSKAFKIIFSRYGGSVLGYCTRLLGDRSVAEDVSQEVWIKVVKSARYYESRASLISWLFTIARNTSLNHLRQNKHFEELSDEVEKTIEEQNFSQASLEEVLSREVTHQRVQQAIDQLPSQQRAALVMWLTEEMDYDRIAHELNTSVSAVKSLLFRARQTLAEKLGGAA